MRERVNAKKEGFLNSTRQLDVRAALQPSQIKHRTSATAENGTAYFYRGFSIRLQCRQYLARSR